MKKSILNLGNALNKAEQKEINGGRHSGGGNCAAIVPCNLPGRHDDSCQGGDRIMFVSKAEAKAHVVNGGRWCCESCGSASWL